MTVVNLTQAASYGVLVDGAEISPEQRDRVQEIRVVDNLRLPDVCTIDIAFPQADGVDAQPFRDRRLARGPARRCRRAAAADALRRPSADARAPVRPRRLLGAGPRLRPRARPVPLAPRAGVPEPDDRRHRRTDRRRVRACTALRRARRATRVRPAGQRDRLGSHLAPRGPRGAGVRRRRRGRRAARAGGRRARSSSSTRRACARSGRGSRRSSRSPRRRCARTTH